MLASITPLGERGRSRSWRRTVGAFFTGAAVGGAALGALLGAVGSAVASVAARPRWVAGAAVALVVLGLHLTGRLPSWRRQVDQRWLGEFRGWVVGVGYGAQLGFAVVTIVPTAATWVTIVVAVVAGSLPAAVAIGVAFGVARAAPLLTTAGVTDADSLHRLHRRLHALSKRADRVATATAGLAVVGMAAVAVTGLPR